MMTTPIANSNATIDSHSWHSAVAAAVQHEDTFALALVVHRGQVIAHGIHL